MPADTESESPPHALTACEFCGQEYDADIVDHCDCCVKCFMCDAFHPWRSSFIIQGNGVAYFYCGDCAIECQGCGEVVINEDSIDVDGDKYCCRCANVCHACNYSHVIDDLHESYDRGRSVFYCDECASFCDHCEEWHTGDVWDVDGESWCVTCYEDDALECEGCGTTTQHHEYCDALEATYCEECFRALPRCDNCESFLNADGKCDSCDYEDRASIKSYSYKPYPTFLKVSSETQFCGFELEVESDKYKCKGDVRADASFVTGSFANCYCKADGSVDGFEIVTNPFSFEWLRQNEQSLASLLDNLKKRNYKSAKATRCSCGLHIHTNRNTLSLVHQYKMAKFVYCNPQFVYILSNRRLANLNSFASPLQCDVGGSYTLATKLFKQKDIGRYWALNLVPEDTVEYRLFNGTLTFNTLMRAIEFVFSQVEFCKITPIHRISIPEYSKWLQDQPDFQRMAKFCVDNRNSFSLTYGTK